MRSWAPLGFGLLLAVLLLTAVLAYANTERLLTNDSRVAHTHEVLTSLATVMETIEDAEASELGFLLTTPGHDEYLDPYVAAARRIRDQLNHLRDLISDDPDQRNRFDALEGQVTDTLADLERTIRLRRDRGAKAATAEILTGKSQRDLDAVRATVAAMKSEETRLLNVRDRESAASATISRLSILLGTAVAVGVLTAAYGLTRRESAVRANAAEALRREREWFQTTLMCIGDGVIVTDERGSVKLLNAVAERLTGWSSDQATGRPIAEVFRIESEGTRLPADNPVDRCLSEGTIVGLANHTVLVSRDGTERPIDDSGAPIRVGLAIVGAVLVFRDATGRRGYEEEIRQLNQQLADRVDDLETLLDILPVGVWQGDATCERITGNRAAHEMLGLPQGTNVSVTAPAVVAGQSLGFTCVVAGREVPAAELPMQRAAHTREPVLNYEHDVVFPDGRVKSLLCNVAPVLNAAGQVRAVLGAYADITDRKKAELTLARERELLQTIHDRIPVMLTVYEPSTQSLRLNPEFERVVGWSAAEAAGISLAEQCYPDPRYRQQVEEFMQSCRDGWMDVRMRTRHGGDVDTSWANLRLSDGTQVGIGIDITERKRTEQRLRLLWQAASALLTTQHPDAMLRALFDQIGPHLGLDLLFNYVVDEAGEALWLESCIGVSEETARSLSRLEFGQAISGTVALRREPVVATRVQQSNDPMAQVVKSLGLRSYVCNPLVVGGRLFGTLSFGSRSRDEFHESELEFLQTLSHYLTVAYDRVRLVHQLREADRRKDEFLALLGHELRNPLAPLRNAISVLRQQHGGNPDVDRLTLMMEYQLGTLVRLVDDLLDVSRITRGKLELRKETVDLTDLAGRVAETARAGMAERGHRLEADLPPVPVCVEADVARMEQVLSNLLSNAARYTPPGGHVRLTLAREGGEAVLRVRDTGIGIEADELQAIWDMFRQAGRVKGQVSEGLGVGLTLVRRLVDLHGGTVTAASEGPNQGSEFTVRLPALPEGVEVPRRGEAPPAPAPPADGSRVLVVDDNRDAAESLALILQMAGHEVRTAANGPQALEIAREFQPEAVLLDIGLPGGMNGYEVARRLRQEPGLEQVLLIAVTGYGTPDDLARAREARFDHHVTKPADPQWVRQLLTGTA